MASSPRLRAALLSLLLLAAFLGWAATWLGSAAADRIEALDAGH